jgi:hypothetical protein
VADFFQSISQFLNLNKLVAVTIPGMIAALALSLFIFPPPCVVDTAGKCWFCQSEQKPLTATFVVDGGSWNASDAQTGAIDLKIVPYHGERGKSVDVIITGASTKWDSKTGVSVDGEGITTSSTEVESFSRIHAKFSIDPKAPIGPRKITVTPGQPSSPAKHAGDAGRIVVSCATWGSELHGDENFCPKSEPAAASTATTPPGKEADKHERTALLTQLKIQACFSVPVYVVKSSRVKIKDKGDAGDSSSPKDKPAKGYPGEGLVDPATVLQQLDLCAVGLARGSAEKDKENSSLQTQITAYTAQLTNLLAAQEKAEEGKNQLLAKSYEEQANKLGDKIAGLQRKSQELVSDKQTIATLITAVAALRTDAVGQVNQAVAPETPTKSTFATALQGISNNLLIFMATSLVLGLILDPIQRMIVSWLPGRSSRFQSLNLKSPTMIENARGNGRQLGGDTRLQRLRQSWQPGNRPLGEIRFGDRRYDPTDPLQEKEPDIYEPNYAIGRGYLTQSEYDSLFDQYYRQSQLATGLILPLLMLIVATWIRADCCRVEWWSGWAKLLAVVVFVALPLVLWFIGMDRLHQFYSEVQARITGNKTKQDVVQEVKILALLGDPNFQQKIWDEYELLGKIAAKIPKPEKKPGQ